MEKGNSDIVADELVDSLEFYWNRSGKKELWTSNGPRITSCPFRLKLLEDALTLRYWEIHLELWSALVASRLQTSWLQRKSNLPAPFPLVIPREAEGDEIIISDVFDEVRMSEGAFERLMSRYFDVILQGMPKYKPGWISTHRKWWPAFVELTHILHHKIEARQNAS